MSNLTKQAIVDWNTVLKTLAGGSLVGGGLGAGTSLLRYLNTLNTRAKSRTDTSKDDDTLYVNLPPKVASHDGNTSATFAMSGLAGLGGTYAAYNLVRKIYGDMRKSQLQAEIDKAQQAYIGNLGMSAKSASGQFSGLTKVVGSGYLVGLLSLLGSAVVTNKILQKQFPAIQHPNRNQPRKIVIRTTPTQDDPAGGMQKTVPLTGGTSPDAMENVIRQNLANPKTASVGGLHDLVSAVAQGHGEELKCQLLSNDGNPDAIDAMFTSTKGAGLAKSSSVNYNLAISWLATDPVMAEALAPVMAAEFYDQVPHCKIASYIDPKWQDALVELSELVARETRKVAFKSVLAKLPEEVLTKAASEVGQTANPLLNKLLVADALNRLLMSNNKQQQNTAPETPGMNNAPASTSTSEDSTDLQGSSPSTKATYEVDDADASHFLAQNKDVIDEAMAAAA